MVRNYEKKGAKPVYTEVDLQNALITVRARGQSMYAASKAFNIPYSSLYARSKGLRGKISKSRGRPTTVSHDEEVKLANGIRTLEKWGFGLSRREVLELVGSYVNNNDIVNKFKNGIPGEEWFLGFKKRHHLSLKVPQNVEYARKKALDPFTIHNYFSLLKSTLDELNLHDKPSQIWNLDETSLSIDPRKSKVVGEIGKPSSRTISSPGKENTTILVMGNAAGGKAPPLIIFKGRHLWDKWVAPEEVTYPGTVYAATKKGWMESDVFRNYFMKTIIPALGDRKPALIVYDGHSTHIDSDIIETAIRENITILKLPPHSSHLLQPLDLSVFKSFKCKWDAKLIVWQRQHVGQKLPKNIFSQFLCETWQSISPEVISNGFKKAGIHPFNKEVIPKDSYAPAALKRFEEHINNMPNGENYQPEASTSQENTAVSNEEEDVASPLPRNETNVIENDPTASTSMLELPQKQIISFENLLLATIRQTPVIDKKQKRTRVCFGSEVLTTNEVLERLKEKQTKKTNETSSKKQKKQKTRKTPDWSSSDEDAQLSPDYIESDEDEEFLNDMQLDLLEESSTDIVIEVGKWVLVKYCSKKYVKHYVGQIIERIDLDWNVKFTKFSNNKFVWPVIEDVDTISEQDIVKVLPDPTVDRRGRGFTFNVSFQGYNII